MTPSAANTTCPGCGLRMPASGRATYDGYYNTSPECWSVYAEVLGAEYGDAVVFGAVHQLTVDAYALQHAGGPHPDKSVCIHLVGLHLAFECGVRSPRVPAYFRRLAATVDRWPHFDPPSDRGRLTVFDVALCAAPDDHIATVKRWAEQVWDAWSAHHETVAAFVRDRLPLDQILNAAG